MKYTYASEAAPFLHNRRAFLALTLRAAASAGIAAAPLAAMARKGYSAYTVGQIIDIILKEVPGAPFNQTVDTIKSGTREQAVTGIVTTMFPTVSIIRETVKRGANFIIAHEPTFYNHLDDTKWTTPNEVLQQKQELLAQHNIAIWRFHDYWHSVRPDGIVYGVAKKAGWTNYFDADRHLVTLPALTLGALVEHLKKTLQIAHVRVIGDAVQLCSRIALLPGAAGGQPQISLLEKEKPDVLVVGEVHEWETAEYVRDSRALGNKVALIVLGHAVSEEPGMEWLVSWLQNKVNGIKIDHIPSNNPFTWM